MRAETLSGARMAAAGAKRASERSGDAARTAVLRPLADGTIEAATPVLLPVMAPRLQAEVDPAGSIDLSVWGAGRLGRIAFAPLAGPFRYAPNEVHAAD